MRCSFFAASGLTLVVSLSGCASLSDMDGAGTQVAASAAGAECVLEGAGYRKTIRTPATVSPPIDASPVAISCRAPGFHPVSGLLQAQFDNRLLANLLFGSSLGALVDLMNDRDRVYPERFAVYMEPASFLSHAARDAWFGRFRAHVDDRWSRAISARRLDCPGAQDDYDCRTRIAAMEDRRLHELAILEERRSAAAVTGGGLAGELSPEARLH